MPRRPPWSGGWPRDGIAAVHNALDMRGGYTWWDGMVGALMPTRSHRHDPPPGVVRLEDHAHPSTGALRRRPGDRRPRRDLTRWTRNDEWYNFLNNVRGTADVLATMDESTYSGGTMGDDDSIPWRKPAHQGGAASAPRRLATSRRTTNDVCGLDP